LTTGKLLFRIKIPSQPFNVDINDRNSVSNFNIWMNTYIQQSIQNGLFITRLYSISTSLFNSNVFTKVKEVYITDLYNIRYFNLILFIINTACNL
jgi:hypothetical protein